ncbi:hypothetical protein [Ruficoccus sp. ZRK36]|uniref:hypothetical protein n=1 Tax=Ruficoccus sp. ZRK36 TaxID=2866311 RepID=UPI001C731AFD|nr:hypothetical protein [Ruficoccus sp. ZRK36]QYY34910.1 hypothetical protein K0V07_11415 [Ruficoccus sp. ZRK36]
MVSVDVAEKTWEGLSYKQVKAAISSGKQSYYFLASDKKEPLPEVQIGRRACIEAERVHQEKGITTVYGKFGYEN